MDFSLYLPLLAMILGGILHSLTDDGASSILAHFNITWRIPTVVLPITIFLVSIASGIVSSYIGGADLQHSIVAALTAAFSGLFGAVAVHAVTNKTPPKGPPGPLTGAAVFALICLCLGSLAACKSGQQALDNSCTAIHAADEACELVDVPGADGGVFQVELNAKDLRELAAKKALLLQGGAK